MKSKPSTPEFKAFSDALRGVLQVSHSDLKQKLEEEKKAKAVKPRPRSSASGRASCGKD